MRDVRGAAEGRGEREMYLKIKDMTWPAPCARMNEIEWQLRFGELSRADRVAAASIIAAYRQMVSDPQPKRNMVISALRKGIK